MLLNCTDVYNQLILNKFIIIVLSSQGLIFIWRASKNFNSKFKYFYTKEIVPLISRQF